MRTWRSIEGLFVQSQDCCAPRIRALHKKIRRWHESALCASIMIGGFAPSSDCIAQTLDPSSVVVFCSASHVTYTVRLAKTIQLSFLHTLAYFSVMLQAIRTSKVPK